MPRIEDKSKESSGRFKKRRAWNFLDNLEGFSVSDNNLESNIKCNNIELETELPKDKIANLQDNEATSVIFETNINQNNIKDNAIEIDVGVYPEVLETKIKHTNIELKSELAKEQIAESVVIEEKINQIKNILKTNISQNTVKLKTENTQDDDPKIDAAIYTAVLEAKSNQIKNDLEVNIKQNIIDIEAMMLSYSLKRVTVSSYDDSDPRCLILGLAGIQQKLLIKLLMVCFENQTSSTGPINGVEFFNNLGTSIDVVRTSLMRLEQKGLIKKGRGKRGKNGFCIITFPPKVFHACQEIFGSKIETM